MVNPWKSQNTDQAKYIGNLEVTNPLTGDNFADFEVVKTDTHLVFGCTCNNGLLESGNYKLDPVFSLDENLQILLENLQSYYIDGPDRQSDQFACNDRM